jgi:hypothetical protein
MSRLVTIRQVSERDRLRRRPSDQAVSPRRSGVQHELHVSVPLMIQAYASRFPEHWRRLFAMPLIPRYYRALGAELWKTLKAPVAGLPEARL